MTNFVGSTFNFWNPFSATKRDLTRTEVLANKKLWVLLTWGLLLSPLASALYLNRGANALKIYGYGFLASLVLTGIIKAPKDNSIVNVSLGALSGIVIISEQSLAVKNARLRRGR